MKKKEVRKMAMVRVWQSTIRVCRRRSRPMLSGAQWMLPIRQFGRRETLVGLFSPSSGPVVDMVGLGGAIGHSRPALGLRVPVHPVLWEVVDETEGRRNDSTTARADDVGS